MSRSTGLILRVVMVIALVVISHLEAFAADASGSATIFQWRPFLAPFHAVVLHFPIGFITVGFILEIYRIYRPSEELRRVTIFIIGLGLLSGIVTASFGWLRAGGGGYDAQAVSLHRNFGVAVPLFTLATLMVQHVAYRDESRRYWTISYRCLLSATLGLIILAGHFGGNLTHGSKYLVENAPQFVRELLDADKSPTTSSAESSAAGEDARHYLEVVQPIFQAKCYGCHGPDKHKGGYRLDQSDHALRGGDSDETAIVPGDPLGSLLVHLILLPPDDDDVMPPEGKEPLTQEELGIILDWIRRGAVFAGDPSTPTMHSAGK